jgi:hypothetical protein
MFRHHEGVLTGTRGPSDRLLRSFGMGHGHFCSRNARARRTELFRVENLTVNTIEPKEADESCLLEWIRRVLQVVDRFMRHGGKRKVRRTKRA